VKTCYVSSGIDPEKVHIIPLGINPELFRPDVPPVHLKTKKKFKFLFVGGTIWRKGIDILLDAYTAAFSRTGDVCLVIKDMGGASFYRGMNAASRIKEMQNNPAAPEILYMPETLKEHEMAGLYTACDCLVHPYRGEGFGLPVAEAMACGLPVIVTAGGATDDFCPREFSYRIPARRIWVNIEVPLIRQGWTLQPDVRRLQVLMKTIHANPEESRDRGQKSSRFIRQNFTWDHTAQAVLRRFEALRRRSTASSGISAVLDKISGIPVANARTPKTKTP